MKDKLINFDWIVNKLSSVKIHYPFKGIQLNGNVKIGECFLRKLAIFTNKFTGYTFFLIEACLCKMSKKY